MRASERGAAGRGRLPRALQSSAAVIALLFLCACPKDGPLENAAEAADDAIEEAVDEVDDAIDDAGDAIDDAVEKADGATQQK